MQTILLISLLNYNLSFMILKVHDKQKEVFKIIFIFIEYVWK